MTERSESEEAQNRAVGDDDAGFVARCQRGDPDAYAVLVRRHQKKMVNIAYRMIGDYDRACDVVQEAFLSAWRAIGKFRGEAQFGTWLCGIVLNHARSALAKRGVCLRIEGVSLDEPVKSDNGRLLNEPVSTEESAIERMEKREVAEKVQTCIGRLDGEQREALILRDIHGFSYEEIGVMLRLPAGTVKSRIFRARNGLKENLRLMGVI